VSEVWKEQITKLGISLGIDAPFLRYTRDQELEAAIMTVQIMASARHDPNALRTLLEKIDEAQTADPTRASAFVFDHPQVQTISPELADEIDYLATPFVSASPSPEFRNFRSSLQRIAYQPVKTPAVPDSITGTLPNTFTHPMDFYRLGYPAGWQI